MTTPTSPRTHGLLRIATDLLRPSQREAGVDQRTATETTRLPSSMAAANDHRHLRCAVARLVRQHIATISRTAWPCAQEPIRTRTAVTWDEAGWIVYSDLLHMRAAAPTTTQVSQQNAPADIAPLREQLGGCSSTSSAETDFNSDGHERCRDETTSYTRLRRATRSSGLGR